uniref:XK-related protein n=1 Tax=Elaeophora elaphi TaxID=1147741 RepID=A0A0R3RGE6_9BILA
MFLLTVWGLLHIIVGTINIPFCPSRPMIPVFLIVMGCLYITWAMLRIFAFWPRSRADTLSIDLTFHLDIRPGPKHKFRAHLFPVISL